jgi:hypothetical protein
VLEEALVRKQSAEVEECEFKELMSARARKERPYGAIKKKK